MDGIRREPCALQAVPIVVSIIAGIALHQGFSPTVTDIEASRLEMAIGAMAILPVILTAMLSLGANPPSPIVRQPAVAVCGAPGPAVGSSFSGPVLQVIDGRTLCIARGADPMRWVRVRLAGAGGAGDRGALMAASFGRQVDCTAQAPARGEIVASCVIDGRDLGAQARSPAARTEGLKWR